jgi:hypothetical protein
MSLEAMTWAFKQHLRPAEKIVLLALADFAGERHECWPSMETLADKSSLTARSVRTIIRGLEDAGLVHTQVRLRPNGSQTSNVYTLAVGAEYTSGAPGKLLPPQEPSIEGLDQDIPSQSSPIAASDRTDSVLSPTMRGVASRAGLSEMDLYNLGDSIEAWCRRFLSLEERLNVALWILDKAKARPQAPMRYVQTAIARSPLEVQKYIDDLGLGSS